MNNMKNIRIEKITLNIGAGKEQTKLEKGVLLLKNITGVNPVKTVTHKRIPTWGLRPGLPIGCKITLRNAAAKELLIRLLKAKEDKLSASQFDGGNIAFGITEYIDVPGVKYDPKIGIMGFEVCITLERPGYRIKRRRLLRRRLNKKHVITKQEAIEFMKKEFGVEVEDVN